MFTMVFIDLVIFLEITVFVIGSPSQHIIGGYDADIADFPHQCSLRYSGSHSCACVIIGSRKVLTAAHCVKGRSSSQMSVYYGSTSRMNGGNAVAVTDYILHPDFRHDPDHPDGSYANNLAVVNVADDVHGAVAVASAVDGSFAGDVCVITGWGSINGSQVLEDNLHKAYITVLTHQECVEEMAGVGIINKNTHVCVKSTSGDKGVCHGDSGGPLTCTTNNGPILVGVTSWGVGQSCDVTYPSVYTRVSSYADWI